MTEPPPYPETGDDDPGARPNRESTPSQADDTAHRQPARGSWASKVVIVIVAALVILMVVLHLTGVIGPGTH
jgi:hypothetical protein